MGREIEGLVKDMELNGIKFYDANFFVNKMVISFAEEVKKDVELFRKI